MKTVIIQTKTIRDWASFHEVFAEAFGFPDFYGRNMDAWIDCMTSLDDPEAGMTSVHAAPNSVIVIQLEDVDEFATRCTELYDAVVEASAFVNWRRLERGDPAVLALSFNKSVPRS
jgi:RNAse (barnase) inhibitor barstar